jgi:hypothetical protein
MTLVDDISVFTHITFNVKFFEADGTTEITSWSVSNWHTTAKLVKETTDPGHEFEHEHDIIDDADEYYNLSQVGSRRGALPENIIDGTDVIGGGIVINGHTETKFIEVISVIFSRQ